MIRPSLPATPVVAQTATTLLTQIMLPAAPPMFCNASTTTGVSGSEGRIIRVNLIPCFAYCLIVVLVLGFLV